MGKIILFDDLKRLGETHPGGRIVHCHGVFDLLHYGHLLHLKSAKKFGDILVVTVTPDRFVNKGPGRPKYSEQKRAQMLAALDVVDYVAINMHSKAVEPILALRPHFYVKGPDYKEKGLDITGGIFEEEEAVKSVGGQLVVTEDETDSSTQLINEFFNTFTDAQREAIRRVKGVMNLEEILSVIESLKDLRVLVVGEPIVDSYVFCRPEALSSKSPTVSAQFINQEDYAGGSLAIANHLAELGCKVTLLITHGDEEYFRKLLSDSLNKNIKLETYITAGVPTPRKTRFLTPFRATRIFELMNLRADQWNFVDCEPFVKSMKNLSAENDVMIAADFGHGMFEGSVLAVMGNINTFIATNVQTNSGNFGFNPFTKHKRYDYLSIDERECRVAMHDRFTPVLELARKTVKEKIGKRTSVTLGTEGSVYFDGNGAENICPSFSHEVVDTTGAGDAYFGLTALLVKIGVAAPVIPFLGNCFAGLQTRIIGNKAAVSKVDFIRTVKSILS